MEIQAFKRCEYKVAESRIVTNSDMHAHNTFEAPEEVVEKDFADYEVKNANIVAKLPANSVVEIRSTEIN